METTMPKTHHRNEGESPLQAAMARSLLGILETALQRDELEDAAAIAEQLAELLSGRTSPVAV